LATFTGWNLRRANAGPENELVGLNGSYIRLPATKADRQRTGDPRQSVAERYGSPAKYLEKLKQHCDKMVAGGYLLEEDVDRVVQRLSQRVADHFGTAKDVKP